MLKLDIDRAVNGDARRASLSMLLVSISLGLHWHHSEIRNELGVPRTLAVFTRSHQFLHGDTEEDLVRVPIQERVPCGHHSERVSGTPVLLSVWRTRERNFIPVTPLIIEYTDNHFSDYTRNPGSGERGAGCGVRGLPGSGGP